MPSCCHSAQSFYSVSLCSSCHELLLSSSVPLFKTSATESIGAGFPRLSQTWLQLLLLTRSGGPLSNSVSISGTDDLLCYIQSLLFILIENDRLSFMLSLEFAFHFGRGFSHDSPLLIASIALSFSLEFSTDSVYVLSAVLAQPPENTMTRITVDLTPTYVHK